jgi:hypothetical protein
MSESEMKTVFITFFDIKGIVHFEFILQGQTINRIVMWKYWSSYLKLCVEKLLNCSQTVEFSIMTMFQLTRHSVKQFLTPKPITEMEHPPYSPDLAPVELWLFPKTKSALKGRVFQVSGNIQKEKWRRHWKLFQKCFQ